MCFGAINHFSSTIEPKTLEYVFCVCAYVCLYIELSHIDWSSCSLCCWSFVLTVDGGYTSWSSWSQCNSDCVGGVKRRTRTCANPLPQCGGKTCSGDNVEEIDCNSDIPCKSPLPPHHPHPLSNWMSQISLLILNEILRQVKSTEKGCESLKEIKYSPDS